MAGVRVVLDAAQLEALKSEDFTRKAMKRYGYQVAKRAATNGAPRETGRGANSIRGAVSNEDPNAVDVSWGRKYYYMIFQHDGWTPGGKGSGAVPQPGLHFLSQAIETYVAF